MYRRNEETFFWHFKPLPGDSVAVREWKAGQKNLQEYIQGFEWRRPGRFQARCTYYYSEMFQRDLPFHQEGYTSLNEREGERQILYQTPHPEVRLDFVARRSLRLHREHTPQWVTDMESSTDQNYFLKSRQTLDSVAPTVAHMRKENIHMYDSSEIQEALLVAVHADHARQEFMVNILAGKYMMRRTSQEAWTLTMLTAPTNLSMQSMGMVTGCWALFQSEGLRDKCQLMVSSARTNTLTLRRGTNNNLRAQSAAMRLGVGHQRLMNITFEVPPTTHNLSMTGVLEGLSALKNTFLQLEQQPHTGLPLIAKIQLQRLSKGEGFHNTNLDRFQQEAVTEALTHRLPHTPFSILGAAGTGKTAVLVELVMQMHLYTEEKRPNEDLIMIVTKSNSGVADLARKLLRAGLPREAIVLLTADSAPIQADLQDITHRVFNYVLDRKVQVIVSTSITAARTGMMSALDEHGQLVKVCSPKAVIFDECHSLSAPDVMAAAGALGEAVALILLGDPAQLGHISMSKTMDEPLMGTVSPSDLLRASDWYYLDKLTYLLSHWAGRHLRICYRCNPPLTEMLSDIFYHGNLLPAPGKTLQEFETKLDGFRLKGLLADVEQPFVWVNHSGVSVRDEITGSWSNSSEAHRVVNIATRLAEVVGSDNIAIIGAYSEQVNILKERLQDYHITTIDDLQGQERMITIVSTVRSLIEVNSGNQKFLENNVGFMGAHRRLCVMLSRARLFSFVVGDAEKFRATDNLHWAKILHFSQLIEEI